MKKLNTLKSGNTCYYSVHNLLSSTLLSKNIKIKIQRIAILPVALYGCETWSVTLKKEHSLTMFEKRVLREILVSGCMKEKVAGGGRKLLSRILHLTGLFE